MSQPTPTRKGAKRIADIPAAVLDQLNKGEIESANLVEWLATDQLLLLENLLRAFDRLVYFDPIRAQVLQLKKSTVNTLNQAIGKGLLECQLKKEDQTLFQLFAHHRSDMARGWAVYMLAENPETNLIEKLQAVQPFANDSHFGVKEVAWLALRPAIARELERSIAYLSNWSHAKEEGSRRFASEATRPRGVWCAHIERLKQQAALGLPLLEPLKSDPSKYVRDSVANWLNDASKTQPDFVQQLCEKWLAESPTKETTYICKRAQRSLGAKA